MGNHVGWGPLHTQNVQKDAKSVQFWILNPHPCALAYLDMSCVDLKKNMWSQCILLPLRRRWEPRLKSTSSGVRRQSQGRIWLDHLICSRIQEFCIPHLLFFPKLSACVYRSLQCPTSQPHGLAVIAPLRGSRDSASRATSLAPHCRKYSSLALAARCLPWEISHKAEGIFFMGVPIGDILKCPKQLPNPKHQQFSRNSFFLPNASNTMQ